MATSRTKDKGAEVATRQPSDIETETWERFLAAAEDETETMDPDEVALDIIRRILRADTVDDILGGGSAIHARDYLGRPFRLLGVRFNESGFEGAGPKFYALLDGVDSDGEPVTITCGARNVIAQAWRMKDLGALPIAVQIDEAERPTKAGYKPMWLSKAASSF